MRVSAALLEHGVFAHGIRPPTVPPGTARIRATVMATHIDADIDAAIDAFRVVRPALGAGGPMRYLAAARFLLA